MLGVKRLQLCAGNLADKRVLLRQPDNGVAACLTEQERQIMYGALEKISVNLEKIEKEL